MSDVGYRTLQLQSALATFVCSQYKQNCSAARRMFNDYRLLSSSYIFFAKFGMEVDLRRSGDNSECKQFHDHYQQYEMNTLYRGN